jgi:hypothetical protein
MSDLAQREIVDRIGYSPMHPGASYGTPSVALSMPRRAAS